MSVGMHLHTEQCDVMVSHVFQHGLYGEVKHHPDHTSSLFSFTVSIPSFVITHEGSSRHCEFVLDVRCKHSQASVEEHWITHRRYRDFQDMHLTLRNQVRYSLGHL